MQTIIIIGGGPGGYSAAIRAAQLGFQVTLIEQNKHLGGTCLNVGCIPSKALLHSSQLYHAIKNKGIENGIECSELTINISRLMQKKEDIVDRLRMGVNYLMDSNKINIIHGVAKFIDSKTILVGDKSYSANFIILATGSIPTELPFLKFNNHTVLSSDQILSLKSVPQKLLIVGAGAIGIELGSVWARLGSQVTIVELASTILPTLDQGITKAAQTIFSKQGLCFELEVQVQGIIEKNGKNFLIGQRKDQILEWEADNILVATGRKPNTASLELEKAGVFLNEKKQVITDKQYKTNIDTIYAIGDLINGPMLAHKAQAEGIACVERLAGKAGQVNYNLIPNVVYTEPEIACVGLTQEECVHHNIPIKIGKSLFNANGRAIATDAAEGFLKIITHASSDKVLGVHILGKNASELIATATAHMEYGASAEDIAYTLSPHPTLSETLNHAALLV